MAVDSRNSAIFPSRGALLRLSQVGSLRKRSAPPESARLLTLTARPALQELAGYTGGDVGFLKEDVELQVNRRLFWDSVGHRTPAKREPSRAAGGGVWRAPLTPFCQILRFRHI